MHLWLFCCALPGMAMIPLRVSRANCGFLFLVVGKVVYPECKLSAACSLRSSKDYFFLAEARV